MSIKRLLLYSPLVAAMVICFLEPIAAQQSSENESPLTVREVVKLCQAGLAEELIIAKIKKNGKAFDLNEDELVELKKEGVTDTVVKFLLDPTLPYVPPAPPKAGADPSRHYPTDAFASKVPPEPGLYYFSGDMPIAIEMKILLGQKIGGKKGSTIAYLIGSTAKQNPKQGLFYMRLPEAKSIEEVVLVALTKRAGRRELDLGHESKVEIKPEAVRSFETLEVGPHLFRATTPTLPPGEYLFFLIGSTEPAQGNFGRGYDFGVQ
jgi:hypothetical protein